MNLLTKIMAFQYYKINSKFLLASVLSCSLLLTYWFYQNALQVADANLNKEFDFQVQDIHQKIEQNITSYEQVLQGVKGLFSASVSVERDEFRAYAEVLPIRERFKGLQVLGFSKIVPPAQLESHIASIRAEGFPAYSVRPAGERNLFTSIIYLEPFEAENIRAFGYDMYSESIRRSAMDEARDTGKATISGKVSLVVFSGANESAGFLMYLPVYRNGISVQTIPERRANITGWVYAAIQMKTFMQNLESKITSDFNINISDLDSKGNSTLLYHVTNVESMSTYPRDIAKLNFLDRTWKIDIHPTKSFLLKKNDPRPNLILASGICLSLLFTSLVWLLASGRARALQIAASMTKDLRESEFRWKFALEGAGDGVWDWDYSTGNVQYSTRWKSMLGYGETEIQNLLSEWERLVHPDDGERAARFISDYVSGITASYSQEVRMLHKNGSWIWILTRGMIVARAENGTPLRIIGTHSDVTRQKLLEYNLYESENRFRLSFDNASIGMGLVDLNGQWLKVNKSLCLMLGMKEDELLASTFQDLTHPDDLELDLKHLNELLTGTIYHYQMEKRYFHKLGNIIWVNLSASLVRDEHNHPVHFVAQIQDITLRKIQDAEITHLAYHDTLTNLPNRRLLLDRLNQAILRAQREKRFISVFFLDIDHFKKINDTFGHDFGDTVITMTADKLSSCIRKTDTLGRQSGDEFIIVVSELEQRADVTSVAEKIMSTFASPFQINGQQIRVTLSIGIAIYEMDSLDSIKDLMKKADIALYEAKGAGRNGYRIYSDTP